MEDHLAVTFFVVSKVDRGQDPLGKLCALKETMAVIVIFEPVCRISSEWTE